MVARAMGQVQSDWDSTQGVAVILNKPTIPGAISMSAPIPRTLSLATAYQANDPSKIAMITVNLDSTSSISLGGAVNNEGEIVIGTTAAVATGTGTKIGKYRNNLGGTLVVGLNISARGTQATFVSLPIGWYFAIRQTLGTGLLIDSTFDQAVG